MRFTHPDMPRTFRVPLGSWLVPTLGALLCILLMATISKISAYRFLVWTGIGQIFYFSYGFWHSKRRLSRRAKPITNAYQSPPPVQVIEEINMDAKSQSDVASEITSNDPEEMIVQYF